MSLSDASARTIAIFDGCLAHAERLVAHGSHPKCLGWQVDWDDLRDPHEDQKDEVGVVARIATNHSAVLSIAKVTCTGICETDEDSPKILMDDREDGNPDTFDWGSNPGAAVLAAMLALPQLLLSAAKVARLVEDIPDGIDLPPSVETLLNAIYEMQGDVQQACDVEGLNDA